VAAAVDLELEVADSCAVEPRWCRRTLSSTGQKAVVGCRSRRHAIRSAASRSAGKPAYQGGSGFFRTPIGRRGCCEIQRMTTRQRQGVSRPGHIVELSALPRRFAKSMHGAEEYPQRRVGRDLIADMVIAETRKEIEHFCSLGARVIDSVRAAPCASTAEQVPNCREALCDFEPRHTDSSSAAGGRRRSSSVTRCPRRKARAVDHAV